jgi:hypothetical protein
MSDLTIKHDVEMELQWEPRGNAAQVGVAVKEGIATLTGRMPTYPEKMASALALLPRPALSRKDLILSTARERKFLELSAEDIVKTAVGMVVMAAR